MQRNLVLQQVSLFKGKVDFSKESPQNPSPLLSLAEELLEAIIGFLDPEDLARLGLTSKKAYRLCAPRSYEKFFNVLSPRLLARLSLSNIDNDAGTLKRINHLNEALHELEQTPHSYLLDTPMPDWCKMGALGGSLFFAALGCVWMGVAVSNKEWGNGAVAGGYTLVMLAWFLLMLFPHFRGYLLERLQLTTRDQLEGALVNSHETRTSLPAMDIIQDSQDIEKGQIVIDESTPLKKFFLVNKR